MNNMAACCRHLSKNFDNVHNLEFTKDESGKPTKNAIGMYSGRLPSQRILCFCSVYIWGTEGSSYSISY